MFMEKNIEIYIYENQPNEAIGTQKNKASRNFELKLFIFKVFDFLWDIFLVKLIQNHKTICWNCKFKNFLSDFLYY